MANITRAEFIKKAVDAGLEDDKIKELLNKRREQIGAFADEVREPDAVIPKWESATMGAAQGATANFADEGAAALQTIARKASSFIPGATEAMGFNPAAEPAVDTYRKARGVYRGKFKAAEEANPKTYMGGEIGGSLAQMAIPGAGAAMTYPKLVALGGLQGLGGSEADLTRGEYEEAGWDTAKGAGTAALLGKVVPGVLKGAGKLISPEFWDKIATSRAAKSLGFTKRFLNTPEKAEKAMRTSRTMLDEGVITPTASPEEMAGKVGGLIQKTGGRIGDFLKKAGTGFETQSAVDALETLRPLGADGRVLRGGAYDKVNKIIDNGIETLKAHGKIIPFEEANSVKGLLQDIVNYKSSNLEANLGKAVAGKTRQSIDDQLEAMAKSKKVLGTEEIIPEGKPNDLTGGRTFRVKPPAEAEAEFNQFLRDKKVYGAAQEAEDAMANRLSSEYGNKTIGLTDTIMATGLAGGEIAAGLPPVGGVAALLAKKGIERYGNQTAAVGANKAAGGLRQSYDWIEKTLKVNPRTLGKYAAALIPAAQRGSQELMIKHWVLQNTDQGYREMIKGQTQDTE